jgi:phage-related protein
MYEVEFYYDQNDKSEIIELVMLHYFIKKTKKTPAREIKIAKSKMNDFIERHGK